MEEEATYRPPGLTESQLEYLDKFKQAVRCHSPSVILLFLFSTLIDSVCGCQEWYLVHIPSFLMEQVSLLMWIEDEH